MAMSGQHGLEYKNQQNDTFSDFVTLVCQEAQNSHNQVREWHMTSSLALSLHSLKRIDGSNAQLFSDVTGNKNSGNIFE